MNKNIKKILTLLFIILFVFLFSYFFLGEYKNHYDTIKYQQISKQEILKQAKSFSLSKVKKLENLELYYTPYKDLLNKLVYKIQNSKNLVYLEVYILTEKRIQNALVKAKNSGVDVRVILEKNPYKAPNLNKKTYDFLKSKGVNVVYSNSKNFSLNHTKMILIDNEIFLSTGNFTYGSFSHNREFMLFFKEKKLYNKLKKVFLGDYSGIHNYIYDNNLILSPDYSRIIFTKIILEAQDNFKIYFPYLSDKKLLNLLITKLKSGVKVSMVLGKDSLGNMEDIEKLKRYGANIKILKEPKIHAKSILVDDNILYIGSINFSKYSLDYNREIGIIFKNNEIIKKFLKVFYKDFE